MTDSPELSEIPKMLYGLSIMEKDAQKILDNRENETPEKVKHALTMMTCIVECRKWLNTGNC